MGDDPARLEAWLEAGRRRRERDEARRGQVMPVAPQACPDDAGEADGTGGWDEPDEANGRRRAADELTRLTEELGLYDDGRER